MIFSLLNQEKETCGLFAEINDGENSERSEFKNGERSELKNSEQSELKNGERSELIPYINRIGEKGSCKHSRYEKYIWHTHPKVSKGYPSKEDIIKVLKNNKVEYSLIFTTWGIWVVNCKNKKDYTPQHIDYIGDIITKAINKLYYLSEKGRSFPGTLIVSNTIHNIRDKINEKYNAKLYITFYEKDSVLQF